MGLLLLLGGSGFDVRSQLFAAGEAGAWYDPSDLSSMWQDAAGVTPVTATSDPVGLILDKSRSAPSMGANQITNGGFATDSDWTKGTGWSIGSGVATKAAGSAALLSQAQTMTAGRYYIVTYTITRSAGTITPQFAGGSTVSGTARSSSGTYTDIMTAVSGNNTVQFSADASFAGTVDNVSVKVLSAGNHAYQVTSGARPSLSISSGLSALSFDGSDDFLVTNAINFSGTDKMTTFVGVRKLTDAAQGVIAELTTGYGSSTGSLALVASSNYAGTPGAFYLALSRGSAGISASHVSIIDTVAAPSTNVLTSLDDIAGDSTILRVNGTARPAGTGDKGSGNFANAAFYIGRRGGASSPFNGLMYQCIIRGAATSAASLASAERFVATKCGVTI
jgi:hypothetical protein